MFLVFGCGVVFSAPHFPPNPFHLAVGPRTPQFLAALMGRSGLGKHRSSPLRSGRVVQSSSKGGDWPQVGWLSVISMKTTSTCVVTPHKSVTYSGLQKFSYFSIFHHISTTNINRFTFL